MVNVTVRGLCREHAITARQLANGLRGAGEKGPAAEIGAERPGIFLKHLRGVALRIDRNGDEGDLSAVVATTLPRKSARLTGAPSCDVKVNSGAGAIFGSGGSSEM